MKQYFLDANAHVPMSKKVLQEYVELNSVLDGHGHPLSPSLTGRRAALVIEIARGTIAELIGAKEPNQIFFTHSCTEACQWGIYLLVGARPWVSLANYAVSTMEHPAVQEVVDNYERISKFSKLLVDKNTELVDHECERAICIHVQNEIGTIQDFTKIKRNLLFSDMCQGLGKIPLNVTDLGVDIAVFGGHKFGGPSGVGFMYLKDTSIWREFGTGSRYFMDIPGTPNVAGIAATSNALSEAIHTLPDRTEKMQEFRDVMEPELEELGFEIIGKGAKRCPNTTFAKTPKDGGALRILNKLGDSGIYIGLGSACGSLHTGGSPLMQALGRPSDGQDYIRISQWGEYGKKDAKYVADMIKRFL
jgi:cysteine desulfurase